MKTKVILKYQEVFIYLFFLFIFAMEIVLMYISWFYIWKRYIFMKNNYSRKSVDSFFFYLFFLFFKYQTKTKSGLSFRSSQLYTWPNSHFAFTSIVLSPLFLIISSLKKNFSLFFFDFILFHPSYFHYFHLSHSETRLLAIFSFFFLFFCFFS